MSVLPARTTLRPGQDERPPERCHQTAPEESTPPFERYAYRPLPVDNSKIRLLSLRPGELDQDICLRLFTVPVEDVESPFKGLYEALSYTWGSPADPARIYVQDKQSTCVLSVTRNCEQALRYLRQRDRPRILWMDAICINQDDLDERARQVSIMRQIYAKASQVAVWLGPASVDSDLAMRWIDDVASEVAFDYSVVQVYPLSNKLQRIELEYVIATEAELEAFASLLERSYFDRLWVWQEVRSGAANVRVMCGRYKTGFQAIMTAVHYCSIKLTGSSDAAWRVDRRTPFFQNLPLEGNHASLSALDRVRPCRCRDQRDRIYTSLAFGNAFRELTVTPDYTRTTADVYTDFILSYLEVVKDLASLVHVGDDPPHEDCAGIEGLPSWVPDWSRRTIALRFDLGFCSGNSRASIVSVDSKRLVSRGRKVGTVGRTMQFGHDILSLVRQNKWYNAFSEILKRLLPVVEEPGIIQQLARVLTSDGWAERYMPLKADNPRLAECEKYLYNILGMLGPTISIAGRNRTQSFFYYCRGRSLFLTNSGQIGIGPHAMQVGDSLAVLLGCPTLTVLRPSNDDLAQYRVVGSALCTDLMDGEGILGPLPEQYETVRVYSKERGTHRLAFRDKRSGSVVYEDPRLPPMPAEWKPRRDCNHCALCWDDQRTGEWRSYRQDPRMDAEALESRGIRLEEFCLV